MLVRKELLSPEWAERILSWPHSGFNVHSLVRAKTKPEAEVDLRARVSRLLTSPPGRGYSSTMDWGASSMPGRGIQRQGREFNMPWKKEMLILLPRGMCR
jgi:hypothetical protein